MSGETIFKGYIREVDKNLNRKEIVEIIFRLINFNDMYYFAEEISTGCIFPIYSFNGNKTLKEFSYIHCGTYYVFLPLQQKNVFTYGLPDNIEKFDGVDTPSIYQINSYLENKINNNIWKKDLKELEAKNYYMCDIKLIKEKITMLKDGHDVLNANMEDVKPKYSKYTPKINLNDVKDVGYDLSTQDKLCNLIGREEEIKKIIKIIGITEKSVILIGESGSGKTSIVEKIALDIKEEKCEFLEDKIIFYLNTASLIAGRKFRGDFEEKLNDFIAFCKKNKGRIIVFIDEIHTLYGLGKADGAVLDAMNILKPAITSGDITIIGATTKLEYENHMANDPAFINRFENVEVSSPDKKMTIDIMLAYMKELENKYRINLDLTEENRYLVAERIFEETDGKSVVVAESVKTENPRLAKNIIENAFAEAIYNKNKAVTINEINFSLKEYCKLSLTFMSEFGYDLSESENLCNLVGREEELKKLKKILGLKGKSAILVGESGSGKTSIVEKLALDIKTNKNDLLKGKTIFYLNTASLTSGTNSRGDFEKKINKLINCSKKYKGQIILFIDEIHTLYGLGRSNEGSIDAMNILKPYMSRGEITIIGATTTTEYEKYMVNDPAFLNRMERVNISLPDLTMNIEIIISYIEALEKKYNIKFAIEEYKIKKLVEYIVNITDPKNQRVVGDTKTSNPTISKNIIEDAFTEALYSGKSSVTEEDICLAILSCDKLSSTFRKTKAEELSKKIQSIQEPVVNNLKLMRTL